MSKYWENGFYLEQNETRTRKEISDDRWKILLDEQLNGKEIVTNAEGYPELRECTTIYEESKAIRIIEIKERLTSISEDLIQDLVGEIVDDLQTKKIEFINLHNELRMLLGKQPKQLKL